MTFLNFLICVETKNFLKIFVIVMVIQKVQYV